MSARTTAEKLRAAIEKSGLSQRDLARRSGVAQNGISRYVCGKREPTDATLSRLADALNLPPESLRGVRKQDPRVGTRIAEAIVRLVDLDCTEVRLDKNGDYRLCSTWSRTRTCTNFLKRSRGRGEFMKRRRLTRICIWSWSAGSPTNTTRKDWRENNG